MAYSTFLCPIDEFHIAYTVICGQTFRWRLDKEGWWSCLLSTTDSQTGRAEHQLVRLWQDDEAVFYETSPKPRDLTLVRDYFRLDVDLPSLSREFIEADSHIRPALAEFAGLRVIRQDPVECLFSFICTSAAPLYRIRRTIAALCREYGDAYPVEVAGLTHSAFPPVHRLAEASLPHLTWLGLGYRAAYVKETAQAVMAHGGAGWLLGLRDRPYAEAKAALMTLPGVGEKIADCVCLFSLDKDEAIPVDTHIRKISQRTYLADTLPTKSLTKATYARIGDDLRARFGPMAGWAQQYLFFHDLYQKGAWESYTALYQPLGEPIRPLKK
ncbi:MAG: DNA glycosylase [Janthinobacterium lividum]